MPSPSRAFLRQSAMTWLRHLSSASTRTGFRIGCKTWWLHIASTMLLTFYRVVAKWGSLLVDLTGVVVLDRWKSYCTLKGAPDALHITSANTEGTGRDRYGDQGAPDPAAPAAACLRCREPRRLQLKPGLIALSEGRCDGIVAECPAFHEARPADQDQVASRPPRRAGHNLLLHLSLHKQDVLRFVTDSRAPFTWRNAGDG